MKKKKLSRREAALIRHAVKRAIEAYEKHTPIQIFVEGNIIRTMSIWTLRMQNQLQGLPAIPPFYFGAGTRLAANF